MKKPLVSIIILNLNGLKNTIKCLRSLRKSTYENFEILVIDNGSKKNEAGVLKWKFNKFIKTFRLKKNLGFTGGNNWAIKKAKGKYIVLLNNDTEVTPGWLDPLTTVMEKKPKVGVAQPKILMMNNKTFFDYAGAAGGFIDKYGYPFTRGRIFNTIEKDLGQYDGACEIFWASGAACIIRKSIINKVGGLFSQNLFNYMEEIDFCWRVWNAGFKVLFISESIIYHKGAATAEKNLLLKRFWEHRNNLLILTRNLSRKKALEILIPRLFLEVTTYVHYIISRQYKYLLSLSWAHLDFARRSLSTRYNRKRLPDNSKLPIYPKSIAFNYFAKNIRRFKDLKWTQKAKPTIAYVLFNTKASGGEATIVQHANKFAKKKYEIIIYSIYGKRPKGLNNKVKFKNILFSLFDSGKDILVATFWPTAYVVLLMKARHKFYFVQGWEPSFHKNFILKGLALYSYQLPFIKIVNSSFLKRKMDKVDKKGHPVFHFNYKVLDTKLFRPRFKKADNNSKTRKVKILSVISWYIKPKGPDILVKAVKKLKRNHPNYHFALASLEKKPYEPVFDKFFSNPSRNFLANLYRKSDIYLILSRFEGLPITVLEAMRSGCLVISSNSHGVLDIVNHMENGIILKKVEDLWKKNTIEKVIKNRKLLRRLIKNGLKLSLDYSNEKIIDDFEKIYLRYSS